MPDDKVPPNAEEYGYRVIGWCREAIEESDSFLRGQKSYNKIDESINAIMGDSSDLRSGSLSSTNCNQLSKAFLDLTAGMTDVKPFWEYRTYNKRFESNTAIYSKLSTHSWLQRSMDLAFMQAIQYTMAGGTSYLEPYWDPQISDFRAEAWDPRDILPIRPTPSYSIQDCYGVIARKSRTVNHVRYLAKHVYHRPDLVDQIKADRDGSWINNSVRNTRVGQLMERLGNSPFRQRLFGEKSKRDIPRIPTVDLFTCYINDDSINESSSDIYIGDWTKPNGRPAQPQNNWSYIVRPGQPIYPRKRMIVFCNGVSDPLYDGPSIWWHGMFPFPKLTLDPMPWTWLGKAPVWDLLPLNDSLNKLLRIYDDWCARLARPDVVADKNSVSRQMMASLDTRRAGKKIFHNPTAGKGVQLVGPDPLPQDFWKGIEYYEAKIRELSGAQDMSSLMRLNQVPSSDSIEQIMESMSLSWKQRSRVIEVFMREYATMMAYNYTQFYTLPMRLTIMGPDGITPQDFDMDPNSMVPDFVHNSDFDSQGNPTAAAIVRGPLPRCDRAREFLRQFSFHIAPGSMLAASEMQKKLMYLQLGRGGMVDLRTMLEALAIPNVSQIMDRLAEQAQQGIQLAASTSGRKASGQAPPAIQSKSDGRTTITES